MLANATQPDKFIIYKKNIDKTSYVRHDYLITGAKPSHGLH